MFKFKQATIIPTYKCNLQCRHCYIHCGDRGKYEDNQIMSVDDVEDYIKQISQLDNVGDNIHFAGGELTLFPEECKAMVSLGMKYGLGVTMVSNGTWAINQKKADNFIKEMSNCGLQSIQISMNKFYREFRSIDYVVRAIRACKRHNMGIVLRPTVTQSNNTADILHDIPDDDLKGVSVSVSKCYPIGRAKRAIKACDYFYDPDIDSCCFESLVLTICPDGSVYPCCAGSETTTSLRLGNANEEPIYDIIARAELDLVLNVLICHGPKYIAEIMKKHGKKDFTSRRHVNICHLCNELFSDKKISDDVKNVLHNHLSNKKISLDMVSEPFLEKIP